VSVPDALSTTGKGARQILTGNVSEGFENLTQGGSDLFFPPSPTADQLSMRQNQLMKNNPNLTATQALDLAQKEAPGLMRTYGPGAAAGLGIMAMAGGFDTPGAGDNPNGPQLPGPSGADLLKQNPSKYLVQNLSGVQYDAQGNIIGGQSNYPYATMRDIQVASNYGGAPRFAKGGHVAYAQANNDGATNPNARSGFFGIALTDMVKQAMSNKGNRLGIDALLRKQQEEEEEKEKYRLAMKKPQQYAYGGDVMPVYLAQGGNPQDIARMMEAGRQRANEQIVGPAYQNVQRPAPPPPPAERPITSPGFRGPTPPVPTPRPTFRGGPRFYSAYGLNSSAPSGGIAGLAAGGYPRKTGQISGPGTETSDSIPAMLSDGEFVMTAKAVRGLGKGSRREGAKKMYALMHQLERNAARG
jgi:hypothetical protein